MNTNKKSISFDTGIIMESLGIESMKQHAALGGNGHTATEKLLGSFSNETEAKLYTLMSSFTKPQIDSPWVDKETRYKTFLSDANEGLHKLATECINHDKRFSSLPKEVQDMCAHLRRAKINLENEMAKNPTTNSTEKVKRKFVKSQIDNAFQTTLFNVFANIHNMKNGYNIQTEGYSYQQAIYYPKWDTALQWISVAANIYPKICKTQTLLNNVTSVPVHYETVYIRRIDEANRVIKEARREEVYGTNDPDKVIPGIFDELVKTLKLKKTDLNKTLRLLVDPLVEVAGSSGTKVPFLTANDHVKSNFTVKNIKLTGVSDAIPKLPAYKSGTMNTDTVSEASYDGKLISVYLDPDDTKKEKPYLFGFRFEGATQELMTTVIVPAGGKDIEEMEIEFHLIDIYNTQRAKIDFTLKTERDFINPGPSRKLDFAIVQDQIDIINSRNGGDFFAKYIALAAENIAQYKEEKFFHGYDEMKERVKKAYKASTANVLYARQAKNINVAAEVNKAQSFHFMLGPIFQNLQTKFKTASNSQSAVQLNMFCSTYHLDLLSPNLQLITGKANEDSDGKFMGVTQDVSTHVITVGSDGTKPVASIVVGTDKDKYRAATLDSSGKRLASDKIEYGYNILPYYVESNLETFLFVETPTRVISDPNYRSPARTFVPNYQLDATATTKSLRDAAGDLVISGYHLDLLP